MKAFRTKRSKFLEELHRASDNRIPVVLAAFQNPVGTEMRNFFNEKQLPPFVSIGTVNLPNDTRQIPLAGDVYVTSGSSQKILKSRPSFALAIADASDMDTATTPRTSEESTIKKAIHSYEFVYGGFVPEKYLEPVTVRATELMLKRPKAMSLCHHRVVIIGGAWHRYPDDNNPRDLNDTQESPLGYVPSVYLQADYVEALLSDHYQAAAWWWAKLIVGLISGLALYVIYNLFEGTVLALLMVGLVLGLFFVAYVFFANLGLYLDFVPALLAVLIDLSVSSTSSPVGNCKLKSRVQLLSAYDGQSGMHSRERCRLE
jgi:CHASE2 domain-containing sensor protein